MAVGYRLDPDRTTITRLPDGLIFPHSDSAPEWGDYFAWLEAGGTPEEGEATVSADAIEAERDRRVDGGVTFAGTRFQTRPKDRENIAGAFSLALGAVVAGAKLGDLRWHGGDADFAWIAEDNALVPMDAHTVMAFGRAVAGYKSACTFACRAIKDRILGGEVIDAAADTLWPSPTA